jgi:uncharacterized protein (TIGR00304 family)
MVNSNTIILAGVVVIILGILLIFLGAALQITSKSGGTGEVQAGGVVMIGPIPIIFGTNKNITTISIVLAIILMVLAYLLFYRWGFR